MKARSPRVTDQNTQPDPTTGATPAPGPEASVWTAISEPATTPEASTGSPAPSIEHAAPAPVPQAAKTRRRWVEAAVVGALVVVGGIGFAAGSTIDDNDGRGDGIHRMDIGANDGSMYPKGLMPNGGMFPGQGGGSGGFRHGDRSDGRRGRGGHMPGDGQFPGWQMPNGQMPGGGWMHAHDGQVPNATQAPGATTAPSTSPAP